MHFGGESLCFQTCHDFAVERVIEMRFFCDFIGFHQEERGVVSQMLRHLPLREEGAEDALFFDRGRCFKVAIDQLFNIYVVPVRECL